VILDDIDVRMALVAASYYRRAHILCKRPVPAAADRLINHLTHLAVNGQANGVAQPHWLSTKQVAQRLGCSDRTARRIAARVGRRIGRQWVVPADALPSEEDE
jgi:AraC-like DNA-binding protein